MVNKANGEDPLSIFRMDFPSGGFSWAEKICQRPSRYVDAFREQFQKVCTEVDVWLEPDLEESVGSMSSTSSAFYNEMSEPSSNGLHLEPMVAEEDSKKPAVDVMPEMSDVVPETSDVVEKHDQEPSRYVDAIREQFQKMYTEVDDWLKPTSDELVQSSGSFLAKGHEISEPTSKAIEPTINESESSRDNLTAWVTSETGILLEHINFGVSSEAGGCNSPLQEHAPQHVWAKESGSYSSSPFEQEIAHPVQEASKVDQDGHPLNFNPSDNETQLKENNLIANDPLETSISSTRNSKDLMVNIPLETNTPSMQKHNDISSKDESDECNLAFDIPQNSIEGALDFFSENSIHSFVEHEISAVVHALPPKVGQGEHRPDMKVGGDEIEPKSKLLIADLRSNTPKVGEEERGDGYASPPTAEDGYGDKLNIKKNDESMGTTSIKLEEFEDVALGDCWDDLDHEEVAILLQRHEADLSYKKKIKNTLRSISWPSKKKIPDCIASPHSKASVGADLQTTNIHLPTNDSYESEWEFL